MEHQVPKNPLNSSLKIQIRLQLGSAFLQHGHSKRKQEADESPGPFRNRRAQKSVDGYLNQEKIKNIVIIKFV